MLLSAIILLEPIENVPHQISSPQALRWLKNEIEVLDKPLFDTLHESSTVRAYTLSELIPALNGYPSWLRITSVHPDLSKVLEQGLFPALERESEIVFDPQRGLGRFAVQRIEWGKDKGIRPPFTKGYADFRNPLAWVGHTSYDHLVNTVVNLPETAPLELALHFHSCTSFRLSSPGPFKTNLPLPIPRYVFQSHLRQWEALSPAPLPAQLGPFLDHFVWVGQHKIKSVTARVSRGGKTTGFKGDVKFGLASRRQLPREMQQDWRHYVDVMRLLSAFAFYSGTGINTTQGLGQTFPIIDNK